MILKVDYSDSPMVTVNLPGLKAGASQSKFPKPQLLRFGFVPGLKAGVCKDARITVIMFFNHCHRIYV